VSLPGLAAQAAPEFIDPTSCKAWLDNAPLANVGAAQSDLIAQLREFNRFPTTPDNRLAVMEALREAVSFVQVEQAKRFTNRALPMPEAESDAFASTIALWDEMRAGYQRCLDAALEHEGPLRQQAGLICQRLLAYLGLRMFHHHRAYREVPAADWRALHQAYGRAERLEVAEEPVKDFLNRDVHDTSPRIAYARAVLMALSGPNELAQRQLTFVAYLLERWAAKLEVSREPVDEGEGVPPLLADLEGERCPERVSGGAHAAQPRYLDARKLAKSLKNRVALLRKGESPARLGLGEDCAQPSCEQLLVFLYRQWCQPRPGRAGERAGGAAGAHVCNDYAAVQYFVSGRQFRQPGGDAELSQRQREEIATFGRVSTRHDAEYSDAQGLALERWRIEDEGAHGMRLVRAADGGTKRYAHGQLVGVRPDDARTFMLGQVRWLMVAANGELHAGVRLLPGVPGGVAARPTGLNAQSEKYVPAFALGAVQALGAPPSLVLPAGWYRPKRVVELFGDAPLRVRLTEVLERGIDFERVVYENA
jgi:hypothetical protein